MLSYQHRYHAGGFADVHKHLFLVALIGALKRKEAGFAVIDAHAGEGRYDLASAEALKIGEAAGGIQRLYGIETGPATAAEYLACVRAENGDGRLSLYPGSPALALRLTRPQDELILIEKHPQAVSRLRRALGGSPRVHIHDRDALEGLVGLVPPRLRRGLALVDPSYEDKDEYRQVAEAVIKAHRRWPQGISLVWYPLLPAGRHRALIETAAAARLPKTWSSEWLQRPQAEGPGLYGSGLLVVNAPWGFAEGARALAAWIGGLGFGWGPFLLESLSGD